MPDKDNSPVGEALAWASRIMAIGLTMFLPGVFGTWLDARLGTRFLAAAGFVLGLSLALASLVRIGGQSILKKKGPIPLESRKANSIAAAPDRPQVSSPRRSSHFRTTLTGSGVLLFVLGTAVLVALAMGDGRPHWNEAVGFSAGVCGLSSLGGWLVNRVFSANPAGAVSGALAAVMVRSLFPLAALAWLTVQGGTLRDANASGLLTAFYLLLLAIDILLHIMFGSENSRHAKTDCKN